MRMKIELVEKVDVLVVGKVVEKLSNHHVGF